MRWSGNLEQVVWKLDEVVWELDEVVWEFGAGGLEIG
jgi:hypothetical protein